MLSQKKLNNGTQPTQSEAPRRFVRRNSIHTLHCRSGSLNKLAGLSQDLVITQPDSQEITPTRTRRQTIQTVNMQLLHDSPEPKDTCLKRPTGSMKVEPSCKEKHLNSQKYEALKQEYQLRGQELELLQSQCRKLKNEINQQRQKRKILQEDARLHQQQIKRLQKRAEKYRIQRDKLQENIDIMQTYIKELQNKTFTEEMRAIQTHRERILAIEVKNVRQILEKSRSLREKDMLQEVETLRSHKYNQQLMIKNAQIANNMLLKQLQQAEQEMVSVRQSIHQAITSSPEYLQLRERYKKALVEMKEMRREISILQQSRVGGSSILQHTFLTISQSEAGQWLE